METALNLESVLASGDFSDVTVVSPLNREYALHRIVLQSRSGYFRMLFTPDFDDDDARVELPSLGGWDGAPNADSAAEGSSVERSASERAEEDEEVFRQLVVFLYTGRVVLGDARVVSLRRQARFLDVPALVQVVERSIYNSWSLKKVLEVLLPALARDGVRLSHGDELYGRAVAVVANAIGVQGGGLEAHEVAHLPTGVLADVLSSELHVASELPVLELVAGLLARADGKRFHTLCRLVRLAFVPGDRLALLEEGPWAVRAALQARLALYEAGPAAIGNAEPSRVVTSVERPRPSFFGSQHAVRVSTGGAHKLTASKFGDPLYEPHVVYHRVVYASTLGTVWLALQLYQVHLRPSHFSLTARGVPGSSAVSRTWNLEGSREGAAPHAHWELLHQFSGAVAPGDDLSFHLDPAPEHFYSAFRLSLPSDRRSDGEPRRTIDISDLAVIGERLNDFTYARLMSL